MQNFSATALAVPLARTKPPRVLQLVHSNEAGGVEALAGLMETGLAARGLIVETHFIYPAFASGALVKLMGLLTTVQRVVRERPDVLIAYQSTASVLAGVVGRLAGCPMRIVHQTAMPHAVHPFVAVLDKVVGSMGFYTANIANSATTEAAFASYPALYRAAMCRIDHGIECPVATQPRGETRRAHGLDAQRPLLFSAGRLSSQKALDRIIRAMPLLPQSQLALAGGGPDEATLRNLAAELGVADRVHFLGYLSRQQVANLLGAADVFVFPTVWETFGLAALEAAMMGLPVVANDLAVLREVLSVDGSTPATFVDAGDRDALAAAVQRSMSDGAALETARGFAPRLAAKYGMQRMFDRYRTLLGA